MQIDHRLRKPLICATYETRRGQALIEHVLSSVSDIHDPLQVSTALAEVDQSLQYDQPRHIILELTPRRATKPSHGVCQYKNTSESDLSLALVERVLMQLESPEETLLTLGGRGDPLLYEELDRVTKIATEAGLGGLHIQTDLVQPSDAASKLLNTTVDVISVNLNATSRRAYQKMMGVDCFDDVLANIHALLQGQKCVGRWPTPWVVPRICRCPSTLDQISDFYDQWLNRCGAAVIDPGPSPHNPSESPILTTYPPASVNRERSRREMTILCDGTVLKQHPEGVAFFSVGSIMTDSLTWLNQVNLVSPDSQHIVW